MKKHSIASLIIWACVFVLALIAATFSLRSQERPQERPQERDTVYLQYQCVCDSSFVRRVNYRIDRQIDLNGTIFNSLKDHAQAYYVMERRLDSLREVLHTWMVRPEEPKQKRKPKR
jgi:hypothetical protein